MCGLISRLTSTPVAVSDIQWRIQSGHLAANVCSLVNFCRLLWQQEAVFVEFPDRPHP